MSAVVHLSDEDRDYLIRTCEQSGVPVKISDKRRLAELAAMLKEESR